MMLESALEAASIMKDVEDTCEQSSAAMLFAFDPALDPQLSAAFLPPRRPRPAVLVALPRLLPLVECMFYLFLDAEAAGLFLPVYLAYCFLARFCFKVFSLFSSAIC